MTEPITDDGFTYYTCKGECGERKMAALFMPAEIASGQLRCMVCMGEISRRPLGKRPKPTTSQRDWASTPGEKQYGAPPNRLNVRTLA